MKSRNSEVHKNIVSHTAIFQTVRRSDFPMQIRAKMLEKGLKNIDIAERLMVTEANVSRWLRGNQNLSIDTLYQLADAIEEPLTLVIGSQAKKVEIKKTEYERVDDEGEASLIDVVMEDRPERMGHNSRSQNVFEFNKYAHLRKKIPVRGRTDFSIAQVENDKCAATDLLELKVK